MSRKETLIQEIARLNTERNGKVGDPAAQQTVYDQMVPLQDELNEIMASEIESAHEGRVEKASEQAAYLLDNIQIAGVPASESGIPEDVFNILRSKVQAAFVGQAEDFSGLIRGYEENEIQLQRQLKLAHHANQDLNRTYISLEGSVVTLELEKKDAEQKRDAAVLRADESDKDYEFLRELSTKENGELKEEIKRLEAKVNEQREELRAGVMGQMKVIESTDEQIRRQEEALRASRIKVISMVKKDPTGISDRLWIIVDAITGEEKEINYLEKGLYTVISDEEALILRTELEANKPIEPPSFDNVEFDKVEEPKEDFRDIPSLQQGNESENSREQRETAEMGEEESGVSEEEKTAEFTPLISRIIFESLKSLNDRVNALENSPMVLKESA